MRRCDSDVAGCSRQVGGSARVKNISDARNFVCSSRSRIQRPVLAYPRLGRCAVCNAWCLRAQAAATALESKSRVDWGSLTESQAARRRARACFETLITHARLQRMTRSLRALYQPDIPRIAKGKQRFGLPQCRLLFSLLADVPSPQSL